MMPFVTEFSFDEVIPTYDLPAEYMVEIGKITSMAAYCEFIARSILYRAAGTSGPLGNLLFPDQNLEKAISRMIDACHIQGIDPAEIIASDIRERSKPFTAIRNRLSHGLWFRHHDGSFFLSDNGGNWPKDTPLPVKSKKVFPTIIKVDVSELVDAAYLGLEIQDGLQLLKLMVEARLPLKKS